MSKQQVKALRRLRSYEAWMELPMVLLAVAWVSVFIVEATHDTSVPLEQIGTAIWLVFIADFLIRLSLAPSKTRFLSTHWFTALSLVLPALRIFHAYRVIRLARTFPVTRLARVIAVINRASRVAGQALARRGFGYVLTLSTIVTFVGAAGMYAFERSVEGFHSFGDAVWWTAMIMTTMGSAYWPQTTEGRALCFLLALYAFAVFGYVTATIASFLLEKQPPPAMTPASSELSKLRDEIRLLRDDVNGKAGRGSGSETSRSDRP